MMNFWTWRHFFFFPVNTINTATMCNLSRQHGRWWTAEDGGSWAVRGGAFTEKIMWCKSSNRLETASEHSRGVKGWLNDMWWSGELTCLVMWQLPNNFLSHHYCAASNCYVGVMPPFTVTHRWHSIRIAGGCRCFSQQLLDNRQECTLESSLVYHTHTHCHGRG